MTCGTGAGRGADEPKGGGITMDVEAALGAESQGGGKPYYFSIIWLFNRDPYNWVL